MRTLQCLCLAVLGLCSWIHARTIHVSPRPLPGIDAADQVRTISDAARLVVPGDVVTIHGGIYREAVTVERSGSPEKPIVFQAAPGQRVVVTGADQLTDWKREDPDQHVYSTPWPHRFIGWNRQMTHPDDDYHLLIGRCEQVFVNHYALRQVLSRDKLARGTFYVDLDARRLWVWSEENADLTRTMKTIVEASVRPNIWTSRAAHVKVRGIRFRYAACRAQESAVTLRGDGDILEDCVIERVNSCGVGVHGARDAVLRRCTIQDNGQLGFSASRAHGLLVTGCTIRGNNTRNFNRDWEAGGNKLVLCRDVVLENSRFIENRGFGIWFDIGNEQCTVRNCLIADNEAAGIFYEISYTLRAHDNVIVGNGFDADGGAWGASAGIALSSSPGCVIERNLLVGNREGFAYREQRRDTPRIDSRRPEPVWNHDQTVRNNVIAYNRDAQVWGWFDVKDGRHWPADLRSKLPDRGGRPAEDAARDYQAKDDSGQPAGLSLEKLNLSHSGNLFFAAPGQGLFNWGPAWSFNRRYAELAETQKGLQLEKNSVLADPQFADLPTRDFRVPAEGTAVRMGCYPRGPVPDVRLGQMPAAQ